MPKNTERDSIPWKLYATISIYAITTVIWLLSRFNLINFSFTIHPAPKRPSILSLPSELHRAISSKLPIVDQVCLSLSNKTFFHELGPATLSRAEFLFPRLLHRMDPDQCLAKPGVLRNQLLLRLESRRWVFCSACLRLHPRKRREWGDTNFHQYWRGLGEKNPLKRRCVGEGIVDLCPCVALTFRDRKKVMDLLRGLSGGSRRKGQGLGRWGALFRVGVNDEGNRCLVHECRNGSYDIEKMMLFIGVPNTTLVMQSRYNVHVRRSNHHETDPIFACPEGDILQFIDRGLTATKYLTCGTQMRMSLDSDPVVVDVTRELGSSDWPSDPEWRFQSRRRTDGFYSVYW